jgi:esterase
MPLSLYHRDFGTASQPPLVILHGLLGSSRNWQSAGADLAAHYHACALDLRNHGKSPHSPEMSYAAMVGDVLAWMDARDLSRVTLMGHSMGGKVAMALAARHPARVQHLVVVDIAPKDYLSAAHRSEFAAMNELELRSLRTRAEAELRFEARVSDWAMRKFLATNLEQDAATGTWRWIINLPVLTSALPVLEQNSLAPEERFGGPTAFVVGGKSRYVQAGDLAAIENHFPGAAVHVIPEAGHNPHMETRPQFVAAVLAAAAGERAP